MFGSSVNTVQFFFEEGIDILKLNKNGAYFFARITIMLQTNCSMYKKGSQQHPEFPCGLPSKYYLGPMLLNFSDWTRTGVFNMEWPKNTS